MQVLWNKKAIGRIGSIVMFILIGATGASFSQPAEIPYHMEIYSLYSGLHDGRKDATEMTSLAYSNVVEVRGVPWLRLDFSDANLGLSSFIIITSLQDNAWQRLNAKTLTQWQHTSAYFNGDAVRIDLYVARVDRGVFIQVDEVMVGDWVNNSLIESQCGPTDDRIPSDDPRAGRLLNVGCTGWIISSGLLVTAGHCLGGADVMEFNVPMSTGGAIQHPGPEDQYPVDPATIMGWGQGVGDDWGVFQVFNNSVTGLHPIVAQGDAFNVVQNYLPDSIRITGYGTDSTPPSYNQVQQTHLGPNTGSSGTTMRYRTDTEGGNSGSPVIDQATNTAVGVHTHGGCTTAGGNNNGTSTFHPAFWAAIIAGSHNPNPPVEFSAYSDYTTPASIMLAWTDPTQLVNGDPLNAGDFKVIIERNGLVIDSVAGGTGQFIDSGLNDGEEYQYVIYAKITASGAKSIPVQKTWIAGGSPIPGTPVDQNIHGNQNGITLKWSNPTENVDGTAMDDFAGIRLYRDNILAATFSRSPADTGALDSASFVPAAPGYYYWYITAIDNETPQNESSPTASVRTPLNVPVADHFAAPGDPDPVYWRSERAEINENSVNPPSGPLALNLNGTGIPFGDDFVEFYPVDMSALQGSGVRFAYLYQPEGGGDPPLNTDSLKVLFKNNLGDWIVVKSYEGTGLQPFQQEIIDLDSAPNGGGSYFFNQFQARLEVAGRSHPVLPRNDWFVDNLYFGIPAPLIALSRDSVRFDTTGMGESDTVAVEIQNVGLQDLDVLNVIFPGGGVFAVDRTAFPVPFSTHEVVNLIFTPQTAGSYTGIIRVAHSVPGQDTLNIYVEGTTGPPVGISSGPPVPGEFSIAQNYPNPFNPVTKIRYQLPQRTEVKLVVYNILGQPVRTLVNEVLNAGYYEVEWNGRNDAGTPLASGVYIYRFEAEGFQKVRKLILLK